MATETGSKVDRIESLRAELAQLESETGQELTETLTEAEEGVVETAEELQEEVSDAKETVTEAEETVEEDVKETAEQVADEIGKPEMAEEIAEHLFRKLDDRGLLPHTSHHETQPVSEAEETVAEVEHVPEEAAQEVAADVPPEPQHFWYKPRFRRH